MSPKYAGLDRVASPGLSVAEAVERLIRFAYVEQRTMRLLASRIVTLPERDIKVLLARLQYEAGLHAGALRERVVELRTNARKLDRVPAAGLERLFDEAEHIAGSYPFLFVVAKLILPALREAYGRYLDSSNGVADYGSVRLMRQFLVDEQEHAALLEQALAELSPAQADRAAAAEYMQELAPYMAAAGGIDGTRQQAELPPRKHGQQPYHIPRQLARDSTFARLWDFEKPPLEDVAPHLDFMMSIRLSEVNVAEGLAIVLVEQHDMPWSFYADISRHCWDEMRHSIFGEVAIEATYGDRATLPLRDYEGIYALEAPPLEQYAVLGLEIEGQNMRYPPGKRQEWEFARDMAKHQLMTTFQDYDWADEVLHVNIARRQLDAWFEGGLAAIRDFSKNGKAKRTAVKTRHSATRLKNPRIHANEHDRPINTNTNE